MKMRAKVPTNSPISDRPVAPVNIGT